MGDVDQLDVSMFITIISKYVCNDLKSYYFQHLTSSLHSFSSQK